MQQKQGSPLAEIHEMQVKGWLEGEVLKLKMRLRTRHPDAANGIKMMVSLGLMNSNHPSSMKLGQALSYRVQGSMLSMDFSMKLRELMALRPPPPPPPGRGGPRVIREQPKDDRAMPGAGSGSMPPPAQGGRGGQATALRGYRLYGASEVANRSCPSRRLTVAPGRCREGASYVRNRWNRRHRACQHSDL